MKVKKINRVLKIYDLLMAGKGVNKNNLSIELDVDSRTVDRYLNELREYLYEKNSSTLAYNRETQTYTILK